MFAALRRLSHCVTSSFARARRATEVRIDRIQRLREKANDDSTPNIDDMESHAEALDVYSLSLEARLSARTRGASDA